MLLEKQSEEFKQFFLLAFTKELIKNSMPEEFAKLAVEKEVKKEEIKEKAKEIVKEYEKPLRISPVKQLKAITETGFKPLPRPFEAARPPRRLVIPQPRLPERLRYIKPAPSIIQIELGKLDPLIKDPAVQTIECNGPDENIVVKVPQERKTNITLTKEEIDEVINKFSEISKIPVSEGIYRVAVGRLIFSAIISEVVGSKFIIKKMRLPAPIIPR